MQDPILNLVLTLAYPVSDLFLLFTLLIMIDRVPRSQGRSPYGLLIWGLVAILLADFLYVYQDLHEIYQSGGLVDWVYSAGYLLFALAGVMQGLNAGQRVDATAPGARHVEITYLCYTWVIAAYALLIFSFFSSTAMPGPTLSILVGIIISLVSFAR